MMFQYPCYFMLFWEEMTSPHSPKAGGFFLESQLLRPWSGRWKVH